MSRIEKAGDPLCTDDHNHLVAICRLIQSADADKDEANWNDMKFALSPIEHSADGFLKLLAMLSITFRCDYPTITQICSLVLIRQICNSIFRNSYATAFRFRTASRPISFGPRRLNDSNSEQVNGMR